MKETSKCPTKISRLSYIVNASSLIICVIKLYKYDYKEMRNSSMKETKKKDKKNSKLNSLE